MKTAFVRALVRSTHKNGEPCAFRARGRAIACVAHVVRQKWRRVASEKRCSEGCSRCQAVCPADARFTVLRARFQRVWCDEGEWPRQDTLRRRFAHVERPGARKGRR